MGFSILNCWLEHGCASKLVKGLICIIFWCLCLRASDVWLCTTPNCSNLILTEFWEDIGCSQYFHDLSLNLLDWVSSKCNVLAIALHSAVYLWDSSNCSTSELFTIDDKDGTIATLVSSYGDSATNWQVLKYI